MSDSIDDLRLTFKYSRPRAGLESVSELRVKAIATRLRFTFIPDLTIPGFSGGKIGEFGSGEWRDIVAAIHGHQVYALHTSGTEGEYPWPWAMDFQGPRNFASEIIALAWAGPPLSEFALGMTAATDEQLADLHRQAGSFLDKAFVGRAVALQERVNEGDIPLQEFVDRQRGSALDLSAIDQDVTQTRPVEPPVNATRQSLAIVVGLVLAIGGGWFVYFCVFEAARVPLLLLAGGGFMAVAGSYMVWETITGSRKG
jgi:hypothetical protein